MTKPRDQHEPTTPNDAEQATPADPGFFSGPVREAVGIFEGNADLLAAIDELLMSGFARCELSLLGTDEASTVRRTAEVLADDPAAPRTNHFCVEALGNAEGSLISGLAIVPAFGAAWAGAAAGAGALAVGGFVVVSGGVGALVGVALAALLATAPQRASRGPGGRRRPSAVGTNPVARAGTAGAGYPGPARRAPRSRPRAAALEYSQPACRYARLLEEIPGSY